MYDGGGGHKEAAGFPITDVEIKELEDVALRKFSKNNQ